MQPFFSVIVVCLNPGEKLQATLESISRQSFQDYEVIIKDGFSADGSLACIDRVLPGAVLVQEKDTGIYDAMNQAAEKATGSYVYYLNCGDFFYRDTVLEEMAAFIKESEAFAEQKPGIYYGNIYERLTGQQVSSNPKIDAFGCYRNVPCHQACFYSRELLTAHPFLTRYKVRADYEQFLWCYFRGREEKGVTFYYKDMVVADYEGGGFSETKENRRVSAAEHKEITAKYMSAALRLKYKAVLLLTLAPLRTYLAENEKTAGFYNRMKERLYTRKG